MLAATAAGGMLTATTLAQAQSDEQVLEPRRPGRGGSNPGPKNPGRMGLARGRLALMPPELVTAHLKTDPQFIRALRKGPVQCGFDRGGIESTPWLILSSAAAATPAFRPERPSSSVRPEPN